MPRRQRRLLYKLLDVGVLRMFGMTSMFDAVITKGDQQHACARRLICNEATAGTSQPEAAGGTGNAPALRGAARAGRGKSRMLSAAPRWWRRQGRAPAPSQARAHRHRRLEGGRQAPPQSQGCRLATAAAGARAAAAAGAAAAAQTRLAARGRWGRTSLRSLREQPHSPADGLRAQLRWRCARPQAQARAQGTATARAFREGQSAAAGRRRRSLALEQGRPRRHLRRCLGGQPIRAPPCVAAKALPRRRRQLRALRQSPWKRWPRSAPKTHVGDNPRLPSRVSVVVSFGCGRERHTQ